MNAIQCKEYADKVIANVSKAIVGKEDAIRKVLITYLAGGHVLLEDVPGTGKTMLLRAFSKTVGGDFKRIQFTPDLLPSDLTGINFFNPKDSAFEFRKGPLFAGIVLADEINRATPRTQSSLLEAMEEKQITVDGVTYPLGANFMVMATQNPLESYGTFPLPEAQIDRFFMRLSLGYMNREQELSVIRRRSTVDIIEQLEQVITPEETAAIKEYYPTVTVAEEVAIYLMDLVTKTRGQSVIAQGVSTRGAIALYKACQLNACLNGRDYVLPEDIVEMASCVLGHRVITGGGSRKRDAEQMLSQLIGQIPVPVENN